LLQSLALAHPDILDNPAPEVLFLEFGESTLNFRLQAWTVNTSWMRVRSQLMVKINSVLEASGISMPCPQREVLVKWSLPPDLENLVQLASNSVVDHKAKAEESTEKAVSSVEKEGDSKDV
jgi:small-conductance mechanosensitive channel